ncbi:helix-turn-helix transcriptional regulator [Legionella brunensis]|uniref:DNA-binding protein n=1 Tax=Legionella brunensis TaxID=29422 RepID=A0A0W0SED0_9GAMM|nr:hypothetical protein [Legionella brunensis]KTC81714.1 hypothetical protein Lbru_2234 [Legionella brunensis]
MIQLNKLYIDETEAAYRYGYSRYWFQRERWKGTGPKFIKIKSGKVLYPIKETDAWFASFGLQQNTGENQEAI